MPKNAEARFWAHIDGVVARMPSVAQELRAQRPSGPHFRWRELFPYFPPVDDDKED